MADPLRVVAIISAFNEADVISPVIGHLVENGVDVYLIDNHSTDGTAEAAKPWLRKGLLAIEQFPAERPAGDGPPAFDWEGILRRKEALAKELSADWFIHHDADEFREAPWPGINLRDAIAWVDRLGYNCIDFRVLNFPPLENGFQPGSDPGEHFTHWEDPVVYDTLQRKCWKAQAWGVSLAASGGHEAQFPDRRIFPIRFLMRHYPIRTQEHGRKKVFDERKKRFVEKERAKGWHVQYDSISDESHSFLGDPAKLHAYDPDQIRLDLMLDSEPSRTAREEGRELARLAEARQKDLETAALLKHEAEKHAVNVEDDRKKLVARLGDRERHIANLETLKAELERHASGLEKDRQTLATHIAHLEDVRAEKDRHIAQLNDLRSGQERHTANLEATFAELQRHAAALETDRRLLQSELEKAVRTGRDLEARVLTATSRANEEEELRRQSERRASILAEELAAIRGSTIWRWSAPLRRLLDALKSVLRS
jgi:hypothetical protein